MPTNWEHLKAHIQGESCSSFFVFPYEQYLILVIIVLDIKTEFESHLNLANKYWYKVKWKSSLCGLSNNENLNPALSHSFVQLHFN